MLVLSLLCCRRAQCGAWDPARSTCAAWPAAGQTSATRLALAGPGALRQPTHDASFCMPCRRTDSHACMGSSALFASAVRFCASRAWCTDHSRKTVSGWGCAEHRDVAGAALIVEEAGGKVLDPAGGPFSLMGRRVLATNAHLAEQAVAVLGHMPLGPKEPRPMPSS